MYETPNKIYKNHSIVRMRHFQRTSCHLP